MTAVVAPIAPSVSPPVAPPRRSAALDDDRPLYEIIDGLRVELPPMSILANRVKSKLLMKLGHYLSQRPLGDVLAETLFRLPAPADRIRRPDLAYISAERISQAPPQEGSENAWNVVPELMVEVISPTDYAEELLERLEEYFAAGVQQVWVVYPTRRVIHVHVGPKQIQVLDHTDELDGGAVIPGFRIPLEPLFLLT